MQESIKQRLLLLKEKQNKRNLELRLETEKIRIKTEVEGFDRYYRFASEKEALEISKFLDRLPAFTSTRPDFKRLSAVRRVESSEELERFGEDVWLCFLCGSEELLQLFLYGSIMEFIRDLDNWRMLSSYLILVFKDFRQFIFIDDCGEMTISRLQ